MATSHARAGRPPDASPRLSVQVRLWGAYGSRARYCIFAPHLFAVRVLP